MKPGPSTPMPALLLTLAILTAGCASSEDDGLENESSEGTEATSDAAVDAPTSNQKETTTTIALAVDNYFVEGLGLFFDLDDEVLICMTETTKDGDLSVAGLAWVGCAEPLELRSQLASAIIGTDLVAAAPFPLSTTEIAGWTSCVEDEVSRLTDEEVKAFFDGAETSNEMGSRMSERTMMPCLLPLWPTIHPDTGEILGEVAATIYPDGQDLPEPESFIINGMIFTSMSDQIDLVVVSLESSGMVVSAEVTVRASSVDLDTVAMRALLTGLGVNLEDIDETQLFSNEPVDQELGDLRICAENSGTQDRSIRLLPLLFEC